MRKTQIGWISIVIILLVDCLVLYGNRDKLTIILLSAITLLLLLIMCSITVIVDEKYVRFRFGIGLIRGKYKLSDIQNCKPISYIPLGWGIRLRPGVILYNVSGTKAVELSVRGKARKIWIGTNDPDEIAAIINNQIGNGSGSSDSYSLNQKSSPGKSQYLIIGLVLVIVVLFTLYENRDSKITLNNNNLKISGLYGVRIDYQNIAQVDTVSCLPVIEMRTNGYAFGSICKGHFRLKDVGKAMLFTNFKSSPFIKFRLKDSSIIYFNTRNSQNTKEQYKELKSIMLHQQ